LWIPTVIAPSPFVFLIGVFDLVITVYVGIATTLLSGYLPHSEAGCRLAETWHVRNGNGSFFNVTGTFNATTISAENVCTEWVEEWRYGIAVL
jgi:hypothetical protein